MYFVQIVKTNAKNWEKLSAYLPMIDKIGSIFSDFRGFTPLECSRQRRSLAP